MKAKGKITLFHALIPLLYLVGILFWSVTVSHVDAHIPIISAAVVAMVVALSAGVPWDDLEKGIIETIKVSSVALVILMIIGMIIGTWILGGIVPTMIYYGVQILTPGIFLVATTLICCIVSVATGSSWTTAGTVGIALIGVGTTLGIPLPIIGGAIISGAYFGDKMSPLSDTTNLAPAMAGANLFDHIRHMFYTTGPSLVISLIIFGIIGLKYAGNAMDATNIDIIIQGLEANFTINPLMLIPPILVIALVVLKIPAIPGLFAGTILGGLFAAVFQGAGLADIINAAHYGYASETGIELLDSLLSRGGLDSMMWTLSLILCAMTFGGIMEKSGMLQAIADQIMKLAHSTGSLVLATLLTSMSFNLIAGDQYLSIVIPGRMYKDIYAQRGLAPKNLSRCLEDSGTLLSPLIPWNTCGAFMITTLGLAPFTYIPYCFLNLINPLVSLFYGYTGITMEKIQVEPEAQALEA
ncbi:Na+/H+ antiporter NhaC [Acidaminobacter sp. JC074]|uniref:Na+/H+ antiporter NhaC n=1 Tax=Acidaminobacter sp. JC074 TaxID=2530199 RepID=UPI001F0EE3FC|nr:Na+/H+ antiporter NhaC [Acidaminobacter sp. JC074]MCH4886438.1 Na+/H+ antiporter NhaC [Acidaminobacter sp. JC074]